MTMKEKIKAIWELMRLEHGVMIAIAIFIGLLLSLQVNQKLTLTTIPWDNFFLTFCTALFLEASTFALNDYYDLEIDKKNKRADRPLVRGELEPKTALYLFYIFFPLGLLSSFFVNFTCFIIAVITALMAIFYDTYLKKIKLLGNFYIAYVMAIPFVFGAAAATQTGYLHIHLELSVIIIALIAFLVGSGREIMKDIMDYNGDKEAGVKSFPIYIGIKKSNGIVSIFYLIAIMISIIPFMSQKFNVYYYNIIYLFFISITDIIFIITIYQLLINKNIKMSFYRKLTLLAIFIGLLAFFSAAFIG
jgi:geranylgeranylglycerol-phosphate geranylgeranyltransferase